MVDQTGRLHTVSMVVSMFSRFGVFEVNAVFHLNVHVRVQSLMYMCVYVYVWHG